VSDAFDTFGQPELCTWRYAPRVCRFQTTDLEIARKLSDRRGCELVAWSVAGGYLRIFQESMSFGRAKRLVTRYLMRPNERFFASKSSTAVDRPAGSIKGAAKSQTQSSTVIGSNSERRLAA